MRKHAVRGPRLLAEWIGDRSYREAARELGGFISHMSLYRYAKGLRTPPTKEAFALERATGIPAASWVDPQEAA